MSKEHNRRVEFFRHDLGKEELDAVGGVFSQLFLTTGKVTYDFEKRLAEKLELNHSVAVMSGTAALHLSFLALGIGPGDEVITTPLTFTATAEAIINAGAKPVFTDVDPETGNLSPENARAAVTSRTAAICPVHLYGLLCDMDAIKAVADQYRLAVVEDAAHSLESARNGYRSGSLGDTAAFSFYATKSITCGEGGAIGVQDARLYEKIRKLTLHGITDGAAERYKGGGHSYDVLSVGWKYNLSNILASILIPQLKRIDRKRDKRESICRLYQEAFEDLEGFEFQKTPENSVHSRHIFAVWLPEGSRDHYIKALKKAGIGYAVNFKPLHLMTYYRQKWGYKKGDFPNAEMIGERTLSLPLYADMPDEDVEMVIRVVRDAARNR